jgi:EAL domain-containing protein (putative c-di-GMP-specific phosphodiesterase class I)
VLTKLVLQGKGSLTSLRYRYNTSHGLAHEDLILELTETALLKASQPALEGLDTLRAHGVGISIDDFGTGYASLLYLPTRPIFGRQGRPFVHIWSARQRRLQNSSWSAL